MTSQNYIGTIGYIKGNLMGSSALADKGYSNENFYPGASNIPESNPTRPDGVPPVTDGLLWCFDGDVQNGWKNLMPVTHGYKLNNVLAEDVVNNGHHCMRIGDYKSADNQFAFNFNYTNPETGKSYDEGDGGRTYVCVASFSLMTQPVDNDVILFEKYGYSRSTGSYISVDGSICTSYVDLDFYMQNADNRKYKIIHEADIHSQTGNPNSYEVDNSTFFNPNVYTLRYKAERKLDADNQAYIRLESRFSLNNVVEKISVKDNYRITDKIVMGYGAMIESHKYQYIDKYPYCLYVFDRYLSDAEIAKVVNYAANRYDVAV